MNRSEYKQCILIVDDDAALRDLVSGYLGSSGYLVVEADDGAAMRAVLSEHAVDLLILDLMLPGEDGLSLLRWLREHHGPPVIIVSARGDEVDRVVGLELGADDYLAKPFGPRELLARVRAVLRRGETIVSTDKQILNFGPYRLHLNSHVMSRDGLEISLTFGEFNLLRVLLEHLEPRVQRDLLVLLVPQVPQVQLVYKVLMVHHHHFSLTKQTIVQLQLQDIFHGLTLLLKLHQHILE